MKCWNCGAALSDPPWGKVEFRAQCEQCGADLHCCRNCVYYKPGLPNDCAVPGTEFIPDRSASNLCEEFKLLGKGPDQRVDPDEVSKRLFGETDSHEQKKSPKQRFDSLFQDNE